MHILKLSYIFLVLNMCQNVFGISEQELTDVHPKIKQHIENISNLRERVSSNASKKAVKDDYIKIVDADQKYQVIQTEIEKMPVEANDGTQELEGDGSMADLIYHLIIHSQFELGHLEGEIEERFGKSFFKDNLQ